MATGAAPERAGGRLPSLTSLRWFAAAIVFFRHAGILIPHGPGREAYLRLTDQGATGVSFFFILSGFVLTWAHRPADTAAAFYRRRFARVVPAHWVMCIVALVLLVTVLQRDLGSTGVAKALFPLTMLQAWIPDATFYGAGNQVSWSLSVELFFYLLFPLIVAPILRLTTAQKRRLLLVAVALAVAVPFAVHAPDHGWRLWAIYINPGFRLLEFVIGICLCALLAEGARVRVAPAAALAIAAAAYLADGWAPDFLKWTAITVVPYALLIFACAQADLAGSGSRLLRSPWLIRLGQWSFAFYLVHTQVLLVVSRYASRTTTAEGLALATASLAAAIAAAYLLFRFVEHPLERRIRGGGTAVPAAEAAGATA